MTDWKKIKAERHAKRHTKPQKYGPKGRIALAKMFEHDSSGFVNE